MKPDLVSYSESLMGRLDRLIVCAGARAKPPRLPAAAPVVTGR